MITIEHKLDVDGIHYATVSHGYRQYNYAVADYALGWRKPNYPMPVTIDDATKACNYLFLSLCPYTNGPCMICIEKFIDSIDLDYLYKD